MLRAMPDVKFDEEGFEPRVPRSRPARARRWKGGSQKSASPAFRDLPKTVFEGYRSLTPRTAKCWRL